MARPRTVTDEAILDATAQIMGQAGRTGTTFASVASATGLSPATLVQRYGTKDALIRAALLRAWDQLDASTIMADELASADAEGAVALLVAMSGDEGDQERFAGGLLLHEDMRDAVLRARGAAWGEALAHIIGRRLSTEPEEQRRLGRLMASQWQGAILWWGVSREGTRASYVGEHLRDWCAMALRR